MKDDQITAHMNYINKWRFDVEKVYGLLLDLSKQRGTPAPISEIITVIKHEYPDLHAALKRRVANQPGMKILFELALDYNQAKERLGL